MVVAKLQLKLESGFFGKISQHKAVEIEERTVKNSIVVRIPFDFKGVRFDPNSRIDLDKWMRREQGDFEKLVKQIAYENGIGSYSYEFEMMESSEFLYDSPTGLAIQFFDAETEAFDFERFTQAWQQHQALSVLEGIHQSVFGESINTESKLYQAMLQAYQAGQQAR